MPVVYRIRYRDEFTDDMSTVGAGQRIAYILRVLIRGPALRRHLSSPKPESVDRPAVRGVVIN